MNMKATGVVGLMILTLSAVLFGSRESQERPTPKARPLTVEEIRAKNIIAVGGAAALNRVRTIRFRCETQVYTAEAGGRMKIQSSFGPPFVYETILVDDVSGRRNSLGRVSDLTGRERNRCRVLGRLIGGAFTLRNIPGPLVSKGVKVFGPERFFVLTGPAGELRAEYFVDAADFLLKRLVLTGTDSSGERWEQITEFGPVVDVQGVKFPTALYDSQIGVSGTYSPRPLPISEAAIDVDLPIGFFGDESVNCGVVAAEGGRLEGLVLYAFFEDDARYARIFTNWSPREIASAGFRNGDVLVVSAGGLEFETKMFILEKDVNDPTVYEQGHSLFTHSPTQYPMFYAEFNTVSSKERYDELRSKIKAGVLLRARKKT